MKVAIVSQWYPPEHAPIGHMLRELAAFLAANGVDVTVITGFPNHPTGKVQEPYRVRWFQEEFDSGTRVWRVYLHTSERRSVLDRLWSFVTFTFSACWVLLTRAKCDLVLAVSQPLSLAAILPLVTRMKRLPLVLDIQDLHPNALIAAGVLRNTVLIRIARLLERFAVRSADGLVVISEGFARHCIALGADPASTAVIPNWIDLDAVKPLGRPSSLRTQWGLGDQHCVVLYAGTLGYVSGAEIVLDAAILLAARPEIQFVIVGDGPLVPKLKMRAAELRLANVRMYPFQPRALLGEVQALADLSLVSLRRGQGSTSLPSKVLGYMAAGRAVIASVDDDCDTAAIVRDAQCGVITAPENAEQLAMAVLQLAADSQARERAGRNGRRYLEQNYAREAILPKFARFLRQTLDGDS